MSHALTDTPADQTGATTLGDRGASYLRTVIPVVWGTLIAQLLAWLTPLLPGGVGTALGDWLSGDAALAVVSAAVIALWYILWRKIEHLVPDWLTSIVLGYAAAPTYAKITDDGAAVVTTLDGQTHTGILPASAAIEGETDEDYVVHDLDSIELPEITNTRATDA